MENQQQVALTIKASDEDLKGRYSNAMQIKYQKEEFLIEFFSVFPPAGQLLVRIIVTPGHMKRIATVIKGSVENYEKQFGNVEESEQVNAFGFQTNK